MSATSIRGTAVAAVVVLAACSSPGPATNDASSTPGAPSPVFYIGDQFSASQRATRAVVDAGTIWLLDEHGDLVFGAKPADNWTQARGLSLAWRQIPGAAKYHVWVRNTVTSPTDWKELLPPIAAPDPQLSPTVVARGIDPWTAGLGSGGFPWSFGNHLQFSVLSDDANGNPIDGGATASLETADEFPGVLTSVAVDDPALPAPFDAQLERGVTFTKAVRVSFSEPMRTDSWPTLTAMSGNVLRQRVIAAAWGSDEQHPSSTPSSAASHAFLAMEFTVRGPCTELLVARSTGDQLLELRDVSLFLARADARLLFLDPDAGAFVGEAENITTVAQSVSRIALQDGLGFDAPAGSLVCALSGGAVSVPTWEAASASSVQVSDATPFYVGEQVAIYEPQVGGSGEILDLLTVTGVDTRPGVNVLLLSAPPSGGHTSASRIVPLSGLALPLNGVGGEVALRPSEELSLQRDVLGGKNVEVFLSAPAAVMVGDTVLVDADGVLRTTFDQAQARVTQVRFAPSGAGPYSIVVDLPPWLLLLHGRARVIALGDAFLVGGTRDTSAAELTPLDVHADQFSPDGLLY
jgi:hypothetical protein